jgi:carbon-monoxide dehydrogenase medium subunit
LRAEPGFDQNRPVLLREVEYVRPPDVTAALRLLGEYEDARALAGGQSLTNAMKQRVGSPAVVVDLADLSELRRIGTAQDGSLEVGAMATYAQIMLSPDVFAAHPILAEVASQIADVQVRNRGTIGGNVCWNDPTNHFPPLLSALDATMTILGPGGERAVGCDEFFVGVFMTAVAPGELLTKITIPAAGTRGSGFASVPIGKDGTCIVNAAASVGGGSPRVAIGCVGAVPVRATRMEHALADGDLGSERVQAAAQGLGQDLDPPSDVHASADYRRHLAEVLAVRAVLQAAARAG